eukprot:g5599.t1
MSDDAGEDESAPMINGRARVAMARPHVKREEGSERDEIGDEEEALDNANINGGISSRDCRKWNRAGVVSDRSKVSRRGIVGLFLFATAATAVAVVRSLQHRIHSVDQYMAIQLGWEGGGEEWAGGQRNLQARGDANFLPAEWNSTACMQRWGRPWLQKNPDPAGYIIFVECREQLGANRYLVSDGLFIAKALNRTLVEFPAANARIGGVSSELGYGAYWDFDSLCWYHRILGLGAFRSMIESGRLDVEEFLTMSPISDAAEKFLSTLRTAEDVREAYRGYENSKVIVMRRQWKSNLRREPMNLLRPLSFYKDLAGRLVSEQQGWENGTFLAVQWRTETAAGNLSTCYQHVRKKVDEFREKEGFERGQVFFNTDLPAGTSGTYVKGDKGTRTRVLRMIQEDYPAALNNSVSALLGKLEDSGVKALVSGVVAASSRVLLASLKQTNPFHRGVCQKTHSNFIDLVVEWREELGPEDGSKATVGLF